jgi:dihydroorotate dehydrogenase electron transfer subunit
MPYAEPCEIISHQEVAEGHYRMVIRTPEIAREARCGQFCMLQVQEGYYPFLRRPMSFERIFEDSVSILYKVEGEGTRMLSGLSAGRYINVQGPLGNGFTIEKVFDRHILVGGGIGVAPLPGLAEAVMAEAGVTPEIVLAARTADLLLCEKDLRQMGCAVHRCTDDGSAGEKAFAHELLGRLEPDSKCVVYCCGPMPMMKAVHALCMERGTLCYTSLEAVMACGDGVCLGCVVEANIETETERMVRVCREGPVMDAKKIRWEAY